MNAKKLIIPSIALVVGIGVGAAGNGGSTSSSSSAAKPSAPVTRTVTKTVTATPAACTKALDTAEAIVHGPVRGEETDFVVVLKQVEKAYQAGLTNNGTATAAVANAIQGVNSRTTTRTANLKRLVRVYNAAATRCRGSK